MSRAEKDRNFRTVEGITFPASAVADAIAKALHRQFDDSRSAIKTVAALTGANSRTVKNWFAASNAPGSEHLVALCRHSNEVLGTFLLLAGRNERVAMSEVVQAREDLRRILTRLDAVENSKEAK